MRALVLAVLTSCAVAALPAAGAHAALRFAPCTGADADCARLSVPLDRSGAVAGKLSLLVARDAGAKGSKKVLFALSGGPGQPGVFTAGLGREALGSGAKDYAIYGLDQRGTGKSGLLDCPALQRSVGTSDFTVPAPGSVEACGASLGARRGLYSTTATVEDLEALRRAIGAPKIALYGVSYGTYTAERYARAHPDRVERLILDSVVPQENVDPLSLPTLARVRTFLRDSCARSRCRGTTTDPVADMAALVAGDLPLRGAVYDGKGARRTGVLAGGPALLDLLVATSFSPEIAARIPAAVRSARDGDPAPLLRLDAVTRAFNRGSASELSAALHTATLCADVSFPWGGPDTDPAGRAPALAGAAAGVAPDEFAPFGPATSLGTGSTVACERWPATAGIAPPPAPGPLPAVPTLLIAGTRDLSTPLTDARRELARAPRGELLVVPGEGHSVTTGQIDCVLAGLARFFRDAKVGDPCRKADQSIAPRGTDPATLDAETPIGGVGGTISKAIQASLDTVVDSAELAFAQLFDESVRFGGLRGGSVRARVGRAAVTLDLDRVVYVPGVSVTGRVTVARSLTGSVRISGRFSGRLVQRRDGTATITLDGRTFDLTAARRWSGRAERPQVGAR
jgi:pimeloyl-ACP methyl ester carboxylesterase